MNCDYITLNLNKAANTENHPTLGAYTDGYETLSLTVHKYND